MLPFSLPLVVSPELNPRGPVFSGRLGLRRVLPEFSIRLHFEEAGQGSTNPPDAVLKTETVSALSILTAPSPGCP